MTGLIGNTGALGNTGSQGTTGLIGNTGSQGVTGLSGTNGATGLQGTTGLSGTSGATGLQGTTGLAGTNGTTGLQGTTGVAGTNGVTGVSGSQGVTGLVGVTGIGSGTAAVVFSVYGLAYTGVNVAPGFYMPMAATITKAYAYLHSAPTGANLIVDINKNGTTIWSTQSNRLTVTGGNAVATTTTFDVTSLSELDKIDLDIDQVGSGAPGTDLTVILKVST